MTRVHNEEAGVARKRKGIITEVSKHLSGILNLLLGSLRWRNKGAARKWALSFFKKTSSN